MFSIYNWISTPLCDKKRNASTQGSVPQRFALSLIPRRSVLDAIVNLYRGPAPAVLEQVQCTGKERCRRAYENSSTRSLD